MLVGVGEAAAPSRQQHPHSTSKTITLFLLPSCIKQPWNTVPFNIKSPHFRSFPLPHTLKAVSHFTHFSPLLISTLPPASHTHQHVHSQKSPSAYILLKATFLSFQQFLPLFVSASQHTFALSIQTKKQNLIHNITKSFP